MFRIPSPEETATTSHSARNLWHWGVMWPPEAGWRYKLSQAYEFRTLHELSLEFTEEDRLYQELNRRYLAQPVQAGFDL